MKRLIIFLIRKHLHLDKFEPFRFTNQKSNAVYYFDDDGLVKAYRGNVRKSRVSLNWLIDNRDKIEVLIEKNPVITKRQFVNGLFMTLYILLMCTLVFLLIYMPINSGRKVETTKEETTTETTSETTKSTRETTESNFSPIEQDQPIICPDQEVVFLRYSMLPLDQVLDGDSTKNNEDEKPTESIESTIEETQETLCEAVESPQSEEPYSDIELDDAELLARVIYQEAGGDGCCDECRRRVADVVLNRVADDRFPNTIYEVLTQENQYGAFYWTGVVWADRATNPGEAEAVERAKRIANEVLNGQHSDLYGNGYIWQAGFVQGYDGFWHCGHYFGK